MRYLPFIAIVLLSLPSVAARAQGDVVWTSTQLKMPEAAGALPSDTAPNGLNISSDEGHIEYEALEPEAEKNQQPDPIPAARMQGRKPMIAIVLDDMGMDRPHSARALRLPPMVSLSYLPYSPDIVQQTDAARAAGHELILHLPMQPERKTANPGPDFLGADMPPLELLGRVTKNLSAFHGYAAVNNHMGSRFTRNHDGLNVVMSAISEKQLMFLDSRTVPGSIAEKVAKEHGIPATHRDVFIDNDVSAPAVEKSLAEIETVARRTGTAIAIGHPKDVTLLALEKWLPSLKAKGFDLAPLSQVIALRNTPRAEAAADSALVAMPTAEPPAPAPVKTPVAATAPVAAPVPAEKPAIKTYLDSVAKAEAKAKEWQTQQAP